MSVSWELWIVDEIDEEHVHLVRLDASPAAVERRRYRKKSRSPRTATWQLDDLILSTGPMDHQLSDAVKNMIAVGPPRLSLVRRQQLAKPLTDMALGLAQRTKRELPERPVFARRARKTVESCQQRFTRTYSDLLRDVENHDTDVAGMIEKDAQFHNIDEEAYRADVEKLLRYLCGSGDPDAALSRIEWSNAVPEPMSSQGPRHVP